ncbi:hypothetical protein B296_00047877 [Ensete ventricosum]|uniref:Uncharacterized protein n=1 Tax=Ensete ventricosum TaxID=4639 RepID=A0A426YRC7_ENSVE|nr:hypothetical protein B296_00047877 [Ensete ventricosum]
MCPRPPTMMPSPAATFTRELSANSRVRFEPLDPPPPSSPRHLLELRRKTMEDEREASLLIMQFIITFSLLGV